MKKFFLMLLITVATIANAQNSDTFTGKSGAINGYDPVAYFKESKAVKGDTQFSYKWNDADWHFASSENLTEFKADPEKYAPQYGGYCAYGVSQGHKSPTQPEAFTIVNGKLYLNYNQNVMSLWRKDKEALIVKADSDWPEVMMAK